MEHTYMALAEQLCPNNLKDIIGQEHLTGKDGLLTLLAALGPTSILLWSPPATSKTTIARTTKNSSEDFL